MKNSDGVNDYQQLFKEVTDSQRMKLEKDLLSARMSQNNVDNLSRDERANMMAGGQNHSQMRLMDKNPNQMMISPNHI